MYNFFIINDPHATLLNRKHYRIARGSKIFILDIGGLFKNYGLKENTPFFHDPSYYCNNFGIGEHE